MKAEHKPSRVATVLVAALLPAVLREEMLGDLLEGYRRVRARLGSRAADMWYWRQLLALRPVRLRRALAEVRTNDADTITGGGTMAGWRDMSRDVLVDLQRALRVASRDPAHSVGIILILALGVGANAAVFGMVKAVLLDPLPFDEVEELVLVWPETRHAPADVEELRTLPAFTEAAGFRGRDLTLVAEGFPRPVEGALVWSNYLALLGVEPELGRGFLREDQEPSAGVVILAHDFWVTQLGSDPQILGREIALDGYGSRSRTVIGVMSSDFESLLPNRDVWLPAILDPTDEDYQRSGTYRVIARLSDGITTEQAGQQVLAQARRWRGAEPERWSEESLREARLLPLMDDMVGAVRGSLVLAFGSVVVLLLIACASISSLVLSKAVTRRRDQWIMAALGASRARILRRQVLETLLLGIVGAVLGLWIARVSLSMIVPFLPPDFPQVGDLRLDGGVVMFGFVLSIAAALVASLVPLWNTGAAGMTGRIAARAVSDGCKTVRVRSAIASAQIALAVPLSIGAGLLLESVFELRRVDPGFQADGVLTLSTTPTSASYDEPAPRIALVREVAERLAALPQVTAVGAIQTLPMAGSSWQTPYVAEDHPVPEGAPTSVASLRIITPGYLEAMGIGLNSGRSPSEVDHAEAPSVGWINRALAELLWPGESAVGRTIHLYWEEGPEFTVAGVVADVRHADLRSDVAFEIYRPYAQWMSPASMSWVVRGEDDPGNRATAAIAAIRDVEPGLLVTEVRSMVDIVESTFTRPVLLSHMLSGMGAVGAALALLGVFGVNAYNTRRRMAEFSLRITLGAGRTEILRDALTGAAYPILVGVMVGLILALLSTRVLTSSLEGVSALNPVVFASVAGAITASAFLAVLVSARRAVSADPAEVLKGE